MKKTPIVFLIILAIALAIYAILPKYVQKAILYTYPGIYDLKLFPYNTVENGTPQPYKYDKNYNKAVIDEEKYKIFEELDAVSYLVTKNGKLIYEEYWDGSTDSTHSNIFSCTKSIIGLLIGIAIDKGYITTENDFASKYIPEWDKSYDPITIKDLLTMSSGLYWNEGYAAMFSPTTELYYGEDLKNQVLSSEVVKRPGQYHYYSSATTSILGIILQNATNMTVSEFASKYLWSQIGAEHDAYWSKDKEDGIEKAYCCFYSNARDLARIGQLINNDGNWNGKQIISKEYLEKCLTPASYLIDENDSKVDYYGYQWWLLRYRGLDIKYARGIYGQYIISIPEKDIVIVRLGHKRDDVLIGDHVRDTYNYIDIAIDICEGNN